MKKCLYLIDVQQGFITENTKHILPRIDLLMKNKYFDFVIASKFINKPNSPFVKYMGWNKFMEKHETDLYKPIEDRADLIIEKSVYTGITENLINYVKENNISEFYLAGIDTDCCVLTTANDLFELDIKPYVLEYYSASTGGEKSHQAALIVLKRLIGKNLILKGEFIWK